MKRLTIAGFLPIGLLLAGVLLASIANADNNVAYQKGLRAYEKGDYKTALREWKPLAEKGYASAQFNLGRMYDNGDGVAQDYKQALKWYRLAAGQGIAQAQFNIGGLYYWGKGVSRDYKEAARWLQMAAVQNHANAQHNLGAMYVLGRGVPQDDIRAYMWVNLAALGRYDGAKEFRDDLAEEMSKEDIATAQKRASQCIVNYYKDC